MAYVAVQLAVGLWVSRRIVSEDDYLLAGRSLGYGLGIFTVFATWFGAETCIGAAGSIYGEGLAGGTADPFGYAMCLLLMGALFAVPLWRRRLTTLADLFRRRYGPQVERVAVILLVPTSVLWAAAQVRAFGQVLSASSELTVATAITVAAVVVIIYTVSGGLMADAVTDIVQGGALIVGLLVLTAVLLFSGDGIGPAVAAIDPQRLQMFGGPETPWWMTVEAWAIPICGSVLSQELVARVLAIRAPTVARNATLIAGGLYLLIGLIPAGIGLVGPLLLPDLAEPEQVLPRLAFELLPTGLYILFAGALLSAILSTVDSALLVAASLVSRNLVLPLRPAMTESARVRTARVGVVVFGIIAYIIALHAHGVYALVEEASAFGSSGIFVIGVMGLFSRYGGGRAAMATLIVGITTYVLGAFVFAWEAPYVTSLLCAVGTYAVVGLLDGLQPPEPEAQRA
jgi:Na+/proline symporter